MLEKYDPGLITGTIGAVIGIILASIFEKTMIVLRFSKLRENLKAEVGGLSQKLRFATDERIFANMQDLVEDGSKMVSEERVDVPHWFCVRGRYRESNKMAKLISKIEAAQSLLEQTLILISYQEEQTSHLLQAHKEQTSSLLARANQEETSSLPAPANQEETSSLLAPANQEETSSLLGPANQEEASSLLAPANQEETSSLLAPANQEETSSLPAQPNQEEIWHMLQTLTLTSHQEQTSSLPAQPNHQEIWHMLQTLASHLEQTSQNKVPIFNAEEMTNEEKPMPAGLRQRRGSRAANAQAVAQTDTAEEMTNEEKPMPAVMLDDRSMVVIKLTMMYHRKNKKTAFKAMDEAVASMAVDMKENKMTVIWDFDTASLAEKLRKVGIAELSILGPLKEEINMPAKVKYFINWFQRTIYAHVYDEVILEAEPLSKRALFSWFIGTSSN